MMNEIFERVKTLILTVEPNAAFVEKYGGIIVESAPGHANRSSAVSSPTQTTCPWNLPMARGWTIPMEFWKAVANIAATSKSPACLTSPKSDAKIFYAKPAGFRVISSDQLPRPGCARSSMALEFRRSCSGVRPNHRTNSLVIWA